MTHEQFLDKWLGNKYRETVALGYQCVALLKLYAKEVQDMALWSFGGSAYMAWQEQKAYKDWKRIENTPRAIPKKWDHIFFNKTASNPYWHCAIVHLADNLDVVVVEQNGERWSWTGTGGDEIRLREYRNYKDVLGWYSLVEEVDPVIAFWQSLGFTNISKEEKASHYDIVQKLMIYDSKRT